MPEFELQKGEKIIEEIKPLPSLKWGYFIRSLAGFNIYGFIFWALSIIFIVFLVFLIKDSSIQKFSLLIYLTVLIVVPTVSAWIFSNLFYNKSMYFITNRRIVIKRGVLNEYFVSVYYEKINDIEVPEENTLIIKCKKLPLRFFVKGKNVEAGGRILLYGIPNAEVTKNKILKLIKTKVVKI